MIIDKQCLEPHVLCHLCTCPPPPPPPWTTLNCTVPEGLRQLVVELVRVSREVHTVLLMVPIRRRVHIEGPENCHSLKRG